MARRHYSDQVVYSTLKRLIAEKGNGHITQAEIAEASGASAMTTRRALHRLRKAGLIQGEFQYGSGYTYTLPGTNAGTSCGS